MKKLWIMLSVGVAILGLTACGKGNAEQDTEPTQTMESSVAESSEPVTETTEATDGTSEYMDISNGWSEEMTNVRQAVVDTLGENYWPNMPIAPDMLETVFGVTPDLYDDYMAEMPMISTNVDTLLIIKAKDDKVEAVEEALNAYRDALVGDTMQYPMNLGKIQASRIQKYGNYVCFVQLGADTTAAGDIGEEAVITQCQEQNELALEVIGHSVVK